MINTLKIYTELSQAMDATAAKKIAEIIGIVYEELQNVVTKVEFNELKEVVRELAEAQKRTEARVEELAEAQKRTEIRVEELAEAQKRTEEELRSLTVTVKKLQKEVGGISNILGFELEEKYYDTFFKVIEEDFHVKLSRPISREYLIYSPNDDDEINIYGEGIRNGEKIYVIGESKAQIGKNDVRDFSRLLKRAGEYLKKEIIPIFLCYTIHPKVERFIKEEYPAISVYKSSDLSRRAKESKTK